ncbi:hypothetical protein GUITHDRAFT_42813, partial [Guillardia theta CCMP2712]
ERQIRALAQMLHRLHVERGDVLFNAGDAADFLALIVKGELSLQSFGKAVMSLGEGEMWFGELSLVQPCKADTSIRSINDVVLLSLSSRTFHELKLDYEKHRHEVKKSLFLNTPFAQHLDSDQLANIVDAMEEVVFGAGINIKNEDSLEDDVFYILEEGLAEERQYAAMRKLVSRELGPGDFFCEDALLLSSISENPRKRVKLQPRIDAKSECKCLCLNRNDFHRLIG